MMPTKPNTHKKKVQLNIDSDLADETQAILDSLGLNQTVAITAFFKKIVADGGIPFDLKLNADQQNRLKLQQTMLKLPVEDLTSKGELSRH
nr:type II toxin-antitoxin system RelB/DinJ family antitoxin [Lactiplantibacillus modestisalitolerans]